VTESLINEIGKPPDETIVWRSEFGVSSAKGEVHPSRGRAIQGREPLARAVQLLWYRILLKRLKIFFMLFGKW
jgi:hypothetical protein